MDKITITLRFWIEVIIVPSLRASLNFKEIGGKLMDIVFGVVIGVILVVGLGQSGTIPDFGANVTTLAFFTLFTLTGRFAWNLLYIPAKLYKELGGFDDAKLVVMTDTSDTKPEGWFTLQLRNDTNEEIPECYLELGDYTLTSSIPCAILRTVE